MIHAGYSELKKAFFTHSGNVKDDNSSSHNFDLTSVGVSLKILRGGDYEENCYNHFFYPGSIDYSLYRDKPVGRKIKPQRLYIGRPPGRIV